MAEQTFNTRIALKYDTYANWKTKNPVLKAGEFAVAAIPSNQDGIQNAPSILIKVGDGTNAYNDLKFASGLAADVYGWAKAATKPTYGADEITGIDAYIADYVNEQMGISVDTDTQYTITKVSNYQYKLMSKSKADTAYTTEVAVIDIPNDTEAITALQNLVGTTTVATQIANAISALNLANTYEAKGAAAEVQSDLDTYKETVETALAGKQAKGDYPTRTEMNQAVAGAEYDDTALAARVTANESAIATLNGTGDGSVTKTVDNAINEFSARISNDGTVNTYKELIDYAATHGAEFTELVGEVDNKANDADLAAVAKTGNVKDLIQTDGDVLVFDCGDSNF